MKYLPLVWRSLFRRRVRTIFTFLAVLVAFTLYGFLAAIEAGFGMGVELAGAERLVMIHRMSLIQLLPESYLERIRATPGVVDACSQTWFGGIYQDPKNFFMQIPVDPECILRMYPEFRLPEDQKKAWIADRQGAVAGRATAAKYGWKIGDRIPIQATIWSKQDGSTNWELNLDGIYTGAEQGTDESQFFFHYKYLDESRRFGHGQVGWYVVRIANASKAAQIAAALDEQFANSPAETRTSTEKAFVQAFANQVGNIALIVRSIIAMAFFIILLVTANTMAESVRERTSELAVLKTLGFTDGRVLGLVLIESCLIAGAGGFLGLAVSGMIVPRIPTGNLLPNLYVPTASLGVGIALVLGLGLVAGIFPALSAMRLRIVDALRRV
jgi:putative ABC transport system permease protein